MRWHPEHVVDEDEARTLLRDAGFPHARVEPFGAGWDNTAYLVDDTWVFRFPRREVAVACLRQECRHLPRLVSRLPIPVPHPVHIAAPEGNWPFAGYRRIEGTAAHAARSSPEQRAAHARRLGAFLRALHALEPEDAISDEIGRTDVPRRKARAREDLAHVESLGCQIDGRALSSILDAVPDDLEVRSDTLVHGDLSARHLLVDGHDVTGVIDWGDIHRGDPAIDLAIAWTYPPRPDDLLDTYGTIDTRTRAMAMLRAIQSELVLVRFAIDQGDTDLERESCAALRRVVAAEDR